MFWKLLFFIIKAVFLYLKKNCLHNFGDYWDIHGMRSTILGNFFQQLRWKSKFHFIISQFLGYLWKVTGDYWYNHGIWPIIFVCFSSTEMIGRMKKKHFVHYMGKYCPWYWIPPCLLCRDRYVGARRCACFTFNLFQVVK